MLCKSNRPQKNVFTVTDHIAVRNAIEELPLLERLVIKLRFYKDFTIAEIAELLRMEWSEVETYIIEGLRTLQVGCLSNKDFSRRKGASNTFEHLKNSKENMGQ